MYDFLRGELVEVSPTAAVVDVGGVGYALSIPLSTYQVIKAAKEVRLVTHLYVREDELRLFGFAAAAERNLFRMVLSVSGVGPAIALAALSSMQPSDVAKALVTGDVRALRQIKGVGKKVAERLVVELKDRAAAVLGGLAPEVLPPAPPKEPSPLPDSTAQVVLQALVELGFQRKAAEDRLRAVTVGGDPDVVGALSVEDLLKACLRNP